MPTVASPLSLTDRARAELEMRRRRQEGVGPFANFQELYRYDPCSFVRDCIKFPKGERPAPYQMDCLAMLGEEHRLAIRGPHGIGKTALSAWVILWAVLTSDDCKCPTTASAWRQVTKFLWPEVHKWAARLRWEVIGRPPFDPRTELLALSLRRGATCEAFAVVSNQAELVEGAHAQRIVYIYDEAKAIPDTTFDATEGAFATAGADTTSDAYALAISTPGHPSGRFYDIHSRKPGYEDWGVRHITLEEAISAHRVSREWADARKRQWGERSAVYQNRVLGEFAVAHEDGIVPLAWVEDANERWGQWQDEIEKAIASGDRDVYARTRGRLTCLGVDVGGGALEGDKSTIAMCYDHVKIREVRRIEKADMRTSTMELVGIVAALLDTGVVGDRPPVLVDVIGIGAGVYNRLQEIGAHSYPFNSSKATALRDSSGELGFANWRSAGWWLLREMLAPGSGLEVCLPPDDFLIGDLTSLHQLPSLGGRIRLESKDDARTRLGRSPDVGDAVVMALVGPALVEEAIARSMEGAYDIRYQGGGDYPSSSPFVGY